MYSRLQKRNHRRLSRRRGFTLIEVLLVLSILVILATIVLANFGGVLGKSKIRATKAQIRAFETQIELYQLDIGQPPTTQQGLEALRVMPAGLVDATKWGPDPYTKKDIPIDPWGNAYIYEWTGGTNYKISSAGPDGQLGGGDDLDNLTQ